MPRFEFLWLILRINQIDLPVDWHPCVLPVPEYECHSLVVVGQADVAGQVDAGARQADDGGDVARSGRIWKKRGKQSWFCVLQ